MKSEIKFRIWNLVFLSVMLMILLGSYTYNHELVHEAIGERHGCTKGSIELSLLGRSSYYCERYKSVSDETRMQEAYLHNLNEIISYHVSIFMIMFWFMFTYWVIILRRENFVKKDNKDPVVEITNRLRDRMRIFGRK